MAAHAASPTCCPVPSHNELVRPCYCHRTQMSAGQPSPAPRFARVCSSRSLRVAPRGAAGRSPGFPHAPFLLSPPTYFCSSRNHRFLHSAGFLSRSCRVLVCLLAPGLLSDTVVSPWSCPSARYPTGPQNTLHRTHPLPPLCAGSRQTASISRAVPGCLLTCSPAALWSQTQKDFFSS